ncbi:hypothetical protein CPB85DRAFT_1248337 [Mucidula mucida]|nr:hypothetical protein CPB85DRAFT_1248337 [Mucidula mucida]
MPQGTAIIKRCTQSSIGRAIALQLASDGFDIALAEDPSQQAELAALEYEITSKEVQCRSYFCDAAKEDEVKRLMDDLVADFGGIDVYAAQQMIKQGRGGRFICGNTMMALGGGILRHASAITSAAFAIRGLTQAAALELGAHNITVNSYACGMDSTEIVSVHLQRKKSKARHKIQEG